MRLRRKILAQILACVMIVVQRTTTTEGISVGNIVWGTLETILGVWESLAGVVILLDDPPNLEQSDLIQAAGLLLEGCGMLGQRYWPHHPRPEGADESNVEESRTKPRPQRQGEGYKTNLDSELKQQRGQTPKNNIPNNNTTIARMMVKIGGVVSGILNATFGCTLAFHFIQKKEVLHMLFNMSRFVIGTNVLLRSLGIWEDQRNDHGREELRQPTVDKNRPQPSEGDKNKISTKTDTKPVAERG